MIISKQRTSLFFRLSISITVFGALFKFNSWPLIILGAFGMVFFHSIQFYQKQDRLPVDYARQLLIVFFSFNYVFSILQLPFVLILTILTKTALIAFLAFYIKEIMATDPEDSEQSVQFLNFSNEKLAYLLADMATVYIVMASLFKILDWELGIITSNFLMIIGLCTAIVSILAGTMSLEKK